MPQVIIMVGDPLPGGVEDVAADVAGAFGLSPVSGRILSPDRAMELTLDGEGDAGEITDTVRQALPDIDVAVLPEEGRRKKVLLADMDATMVVGETIDELAAALGKEAEVSVITERAMRGEIDFEAALDERVAMLAGLDAAKIDRIAGTLTYSAGAETLVRTMAKHGARCVLVSGGFDRVTGVVCEKLGFHSDRANHLEVSDGRLTGTARKPVVDAGTKLATLRETAMAAGCALADCLAIGDGANDKPMVEAAGLGIAYRAKPALRAATSAYIDHTDLRTALYFQGYEDSEIADAIV